MNIILEFLSFRILLNVKHNLALQHLKTGYVKLSVDTIKELSATAFLRQ